MHRVGEDQEERLEVVPAQLRVRVTWSAPRQTGHSVRVDDCWAMNSRGESMRKPLCG